LIITRGGGSIEDLQAFNDETLARSIAASPIPVISAVGHEIDFTITDFVSDLRAATPSAAAELVSPDASSILNRLTELQNRIFIGLSRQTQVHKTRLENIEARLELLHPARQLLQQQQSLDGLSNRLELAIKNLNREKQTKLSFLRDHVAAISPAVNLRSWKTQLVSINTRLLRESRNISASRRLGVAALSRQLNSISPLQTLSRGYSVTYDVSGKVIKTFPR
jgi:exodeoxyribonuclease VII large subunit